MSKMDATDTDAVAVPFLRALTAWLDAGRSSGGALRPGLLATGLVISEHVRERLPLTEGDVATSSQIRDQSGPNVQGILAAHGETRRFLSEGGRTSRNSRALGVALAANLTEVAQSTMQLPSTTEQRRVIADVLQGHIVIVIQEEFFARQRLRPDLAAHLSLVAVIKQLLADAATRPGNAAGAVAQHLVGAALQLRFPTVAVGVDSYTTADQQTARSGDFQVGDAAIHVTVSPGDQLFSRRCAQNLASGLRPFVIVPESSQVAAGQLAVNSHLSDRVTVTSIEHFIAESLEQMGEFDGRASRAQLARLFDEYNRRVEAIEPDPSLLIGS